MRKHTLKEWLMATRPWSFPASTMPVMVALSYIFVSRYGDYSSVNWCLAVVCLLGALIFHFGGNLVSDYFDYKTGVDRQDNTGQRLLVDGVFKAKTILVYGLVLLCIGSALGLFIVWKSNVYVLYVGLAGLALTLLYSKFKYNAFGDLDVFLIFGVLEAAGTSFAMTGVFEVEILLNVIPVGFLVVAILHSNNTRDMEFDARAKVRTFAMNIGFRASKYYYLGLVLCAYLMVAVLVIAGICPWTSVAVLLSLPVAVKNVKMMLSSKQISDIAPLDGMTAKLVLVFSLLLIVSNVLSPFVS